MNYKITLLSIVLLMPTLVQASSHCMTLFESNNYKQALKYCHEEANNGNVKASEILTQIYSTKGELLNYSKAFEWAKVSSDKGSAYSQAALGLMYLRGDGTTKNIEKAQYYIQLAINNGNKGALELRKLMKRAGLWRKPSNKHIHSSK